MSLSTILYMRTNWRYSSTIFLRLQVKGTTNMQQKVPKLNLFEYSKTRSVIFNTHVDYFIFRELYILSL